ncbi:MAG TPA: undecaprenyl-diphosphatase UppP [Candidatus Paceibacterota bacterium]|nr:undecaprenyl-diphosphatase UppP [Candidatus Paceibacterota bacterium]
MEILNFIILGIVQGVTEFLPISSSGHLILAREFLNIQTEFGLTHDAIFQLATTLAVCIYFRKDIYELIKSINNGDSNNKKLLSGIIIGTIPAIFFGFILEGQMDTIFRDVRLVAITMFVGSVIIYFAEIISKQNKELTLKNSFLIGLFQSLALIPGMSRSGMTISGGLFLGLKRESAIRFSFLLSIPILIGSGLKKTLDLFSTGANNDFGILVFVGAIASFVVGIASIHFLISYLKKNTMMVFVIYRIIVGIILLVAFL